MYVSACVIACLCVSGASRRGWSVPATTVDAHARVSGLYTHVRVSGLYTHFGVSGLYAHVRVSGLYDHVGVCGLYAHVRVGGPDNQLWLVWRKTRLWFVFWQRKTGNSWDLLFICQRKIGLWFVFWQRKTRLWFVFLQRKTRLWFAFYLSEEDLIVICFFLSEEGWILFVFSSDRGRLDCNWLFIFFTEEDWKLRHSQEHATGVLHWVLCPSLRCSPLSRLLGLLVPVGVVFYRVFRRDYVTITWVIPTFELWSLQICMWRFVRNMFIWLDFFIRLNILCVCVCVYIIMCLNIRWLQN